MNSVREIIAENIFNNTVKVFDGLLPANEDECVAVSFEEGRSSQYFGMATALRRPTLKILVRSKNYTDATAIVQKIRKYLDKYRDNTISGIVARGNETYMGRDANNCAIYMILFSIFLKEDIING